MQNVINLLRSVASMGTMGSPAQTVVAESPAQTVVAEQRRNFTRNMRTFPYSRPGSRERGRHVSQMSKGRTLTRTFVCLNSSDQEEIPDVEQKIRLYRNKLGESRIQFPVNSDAKACGDIIVAQYPQLKECGGFEILNNSNGKKRLRLLKSGPCSLEEMRTFGVGKLYLRPIQRDIPLEEVQLPSEKEKCLGCGVEVELAEMRSHLETCSNKEDTSDDEDLPPANVDAEPTTQVENPTINTHMMPQQGQTNRMQAMYEQPPEVPEVPSEILTIDECVSETVEERNSCDDPVTILKTFQSKVMVGRPLDISEENESLEGETNTIYVSRSTFFIQAMEEINTCPSKKLRRPLDVVYNAEQAVDSGGPRREFLTTALREIKDSLFVVEGENGYVLTCDDFHLRLKHYYAAGIILGLSIIQNGPLPTFISENCIQALVEGNGEQLSASGRQMEMGLAKLGILQLIRGLPIMRFLLRKTATVPLTQKKLVFLLKVSFSEEGSNRKMKEERAYRVFLKYLKEVTAGRRGNVTLERILKFVTGAENEPTLGFAMAPSTHFSDNAVMPTSNTCINRLYLPLKEKEEEDMFRLFDYSFLNDYFGLI